MTTTIKSLSLILVMVITIVITAMMATPLNFQHSYLRPVFRLVIQAIHRRLI